MEDHFNLIDTPEVAEIMVRIFDTSSSTEELVAYLRPQVIRVFNQHRAIPEDIFEKAGVSRIRDLLTQNMPAKANLKKAEFGEILATLFAEQVEGRWVPVYKHTHKTARNMPVFGLDCVAILAESENDLQFYFYEVKTTESSTRYPTVCYQIRNSFQSLSPEVFDTEVAFIWKQVQPDQQTQQIVDRLAEISYEEADLVLCAFLVASAENYQSSFPVPFCSGAYDREIEAVVVRIEELSEVYLTIMGQG
jgi:hypothetical protein